MTSRGRSLPLRGLVLLQSPIQKWHGEFPLLLPVMAVPGSLLREHLLSNFCVPGPVLSGLRVLPTAFEIGTVFDLTLQTRKLSQCG